MPRYTAEHVPSYRLHKKSGNRVVTIAGKDHYLGKYKTPESQQSYNRLISEWFAARRNPTVLNVTRQNATTAPDPINVEEVILAFWTHAQGYYKDRDGNPTSELKNFADSLRSLRKLYGKSPAATFGPKCLKACQADMIAQGLARNTINRRIGRIRQTFKWAVAEELLPPGVHEGLRAVSGLKRGRTEAKETESVKPVSEEHARAAISHASRYIAAMIELQLLTGMRSGELVIMRTGDIDRRGPVWVYTPFKHKTQHHGHTRTVYLGKRAQEILTPFLKLDAVAYLFSPAEATVERFEAATAKRRTPLNCGNIAGRDRKPQPKRSPGERYRDTSYAKAVARACDRAFPPPNSVTGDAVTAWRKSHRFHPHQLRHAAATRFRRDYNLETARALLGQKSMNAAEIYAEMDMEKARNVMRDVG